MNFSSLARTALLVGALVGGTSATAQAQILSGSGASSVALKGTKIEMLTLNVAGVLNTNADLATSPDLGNLTATLDWSLSPSRGNVYLVGYLGTAYALTDGAGNDVAPSAFWGACTSASLAGGTCPATLAGFAGPNAVLGGISSLTLWSSPAITGALRNQTGVAIGLNFQLDPTVVAALPAGVYNGTLYLRAYAQ
jgi:hypothetical protein